MIGLDADKKYAVKYENENLLGGTVKDIAFTDDNPQKLIVVGSGQKRAACVDTGSKSKKGDITGHTGTVLTCDLKVPKPWKLVVSGEDREI